ncbi:MAG: hypothetical protein CM1200mP25_4250 [Acidobacteriota bacterium]|nr:MAG: hypothetical protein CM1200mP25_4250 [Acidobacteriota bacterium]
MTADHELEVRVPIQAGTRLCQLPLRIRRPHRVCRAINQALTRSIFLDRSMGGPR